MTLLELAERCEQTTGHDRELDVAVMGACGLTQKYASSHGYGPVRGGIQKGSVRHPTARFGAVSAPYFTTSHDAARALVPEGWSGGVNWPIDRNYGPYDAIFGSPGIDPIFVTGSGATPALALCAAALRAHAAQCDRSGEADKTAKTGLAEGESAVGSEASDAPKGEA